MVLLGTAHPSFNGGDLIFQLVMFSLLIALISGIIVIFRTFITRNKRLQRVEEKLDRLLEENRDK